MYVKEEELKNGPKFGKDYFIQWFEELTLKCKRSSKEGIKICKRKEKKD